MTYTYKFKNDSEQEVERYVGIESYSTPDFEGIGGIFKDNYKDFIVKEITENGKILEIKEDRETPPYLRNRDNYTTFNLIKINKVTFKALSQIARELKIPKHKLYYSGLKDKRSISVQKISIEGNYVPELKKLNLRDLFIRSITPTKKPVLMGSNRGNNFTIAIRKIKPREGLKNHIQGLMNVLSQIGFPNYFGLQRFGKYRPNSHLIGKYLLEEDYERAFKEFVTTTYSSENKSLYKVRKKIERSLNNPKKLRKAYKTFPKSLNFECTLIEHLLQFPQDYVGAFKQLDDDIINLLINAFQSFIFNKLISLRTKKGISLLKPVKGDVVCILDDFKGNITDTRYLYGNRFDKYIEQAMELDRAAIVVPIIGYDTNLDNFPLMKSLFNEVSQNEGINREIFDSRFLNKFNLKGAYRAMMVKPIGLSLVEFDDDDVYKSCKKLKIEFSLNKGSYATMLLREMMKN
ncbi:MAG: tRNA pseudouridine(13) synthase TruD [Candidatus Lokiarchaeota archaeon]|nr:tRNA pseudouridine(13) synthase TruD [Candidatus Lokiarchaeota archaeon]MBD3200851.1 tRNA pseudouridine(13) synthase TruD [Candidatus Lokiarchaeota archaeon]